LFLLWISVATALLPKCPLCLVGLLGVMGLAGLSFQHAVFPLTSLLVAATAVAVLPRSKEETDIANRPSLRSVQQLWWPRAGFWSTQCLSTT
jgi:hypothetical protein